MRQRMYLESMQDIFTRASKVMVDTKSNNNMLYLPLDKIMHLAARKRRQVDRPARRCACPLPASPPIQPPLRSNVASVPQSSGSTGSSNTLPRDRTSR